LKGNHSSNFAGWLIGYNARRPSVLCSVANDIIASTASYIQSLYPVLPKTMSTVDLGLQWILTEFWKHRQLFMICYKFRVSITRFHCVKRKKNLGTKCINFNNDFVHASFAQKVLSIVPMYFFIQTFGIFFPQTHTKCF
jgi:hypothetical protein